MRVRIPIAVALSFYLFFAAPVRAENAKCTLTKEMLSASAYAMQGASGWVLANAPAWKRVFHFLKAEKIRHIPKKPPANLCPGSTGKEEQVFGASFVPFLLTGKSECEGQLAKSF